MKKAGPKSKIERRYVAMIRCFVRAVKAGYYRRAAALGGELDRAAAAIDKDRVKQLDDWVFSGSAKPVGRRSL